MSAASGASWSTTRRRRSSPTPPIPERRDTSPAGSDEASEYRTRVVTAFLVVLGIVALIGWAMTIVVARELRKSRREVADARRVAEAGDHASLTDAIADERRESEDRVAHA